MFRISCLFLMHLASELVPTIHAHHDVFAVQQSDPNINALGSSPTLDDSPLGLNTLQDHKRQVSASSPAAAPTTPPFNPLAADNVAVYVGHSPGNFNASLPQLCDDININIILLAFIRSFNGPNQLPTFDIAPNCDSRKVKNYSAPFSCPTYAAQVAQCQAQGKKLFISIGGSSSNTSFTSAQQAVDTATTVWNIFGEGTGSQSLRPFGNITLDGVDIDQEGTAATTYYDVFAQTLRSLFATSSTHSYYLSATPSCANNSAILPNGFYQSAHFVFPRFYNAKVCNVGSKGFIPSMIKWRDYLVSISGPESLFPRLFIGALSFDNLNSGYVSGPSFQTSVRAGANATSDRFGGVMLWDGTNGEVKDTANRTYIGYTKQALCEP